MSPVKVVLDTNVYIAAALNPESIIFQLVRDTAKQRIASYFTSSAILLELQNKLENKFGFDRAEVVSWLRHLEEVSTVVHPLVRLKVASDPDDNKILECAVEARADLVITADRGLLKLKRYENIQIAHPTMLKHWFKPPGVST